jgi:hypothetical protein
VVRSCEGEAESGGKELQAGVDLLLAGRKRRRSGARRWRWGWRRGGVDGGGGQVPARGARRRVRTDEGAVAARKMGEQVPPQAMEGEGDRLPGRFEGKKMR